MDNPPDLTHLFFRQFLRDNPTLVSKRPMISSHYFLIRTVILEKKIVRCGPDKKFILKVAVELSLENATDNFTRKRLKLTSYEE